MKNIKAIIHDWDDTITNAFETYGQFYTDLGEHYKLGEVPFESLRKHWGGTIPQIVNGVWPDLTQEESEEYVEDFIKALKKWRKSYDATTFPGAKETIQKLKERGYALGVISSGHRPAIELIYQNEIDPDLKYHDFIFDAKDLGISKPNPAVFDRPMEILKEQGIDEEDVIYVGDSLHDYVAARERGIEFVAVTTGVKDKEDFVKEGLEEKLILETFNDILKLL